jgi:hypothetical protein
MADLKPRQYKRLGRIEERNPERAAKVASRMEKRASRTERGKEIASKAEENRTGYVKMANGLMTGQGRAKQAAVKTMVEKGRTKRPDTPLAATPEPFSSFK